MIDVKEAVKIAYENLKMFQSEITIDNILLEEVERDLAPDNEGGWLITFSFDAPTQSKSPILEAIQPSHSRKYRYIKLDKNGEFLAFKIREFQTA